MVRIGFIGAGRMGSALIKSVYDSKIEDTLIKTIKAAAKRSRELGKE